jgi:hypothetical protein
VKQFIEKAKEQAKDSAFPFVSAETFSTGMTLRDYFAAQAMQVFIANDETDMDQDVRDAYMLADKMLAERSKT